MAFSFGNSGNAMLGNTAGAGGLTVGSPLQTIQTDDLGFLSIAGDAKVRLTTPWTSLPSSTASLLSIASRKGLVAAAGPDQVVIATTESVRKAFEAPQDGDTDVRSFEPQLKIPMPMRVSHLSFTADENYLILSAESGGGLAVYEVQSLLSGSTNSAFELPTNGETLRAMIPNPTPEKAELCAIVTNNGNLHMANLKDRQISNPLKNQVSCVSWSSKGKQLCAGLADGTIFQMTPEGEGKGEIPRPPNMDDFHVSSLTWLENHLFLSIHTSNNQSPPKSIYHIITRQPPSSFTFQQLTDPVEPFGSDKAPHHSILRIRDFAPALQDMLIIASTAVSEMGIVTRSKTPLATDQPAESITGVFTLTEFLDDTKRPTLPMTDSMDDAVPVGVALDLSGKDKVYKPIPSDVELEESPGPLPGCWALTHDGVLCAWWIVYNDSIRQGTSYPHLAVVEGTSTATPAPAAQPAPAASASPFGSSGTSAFGSTAQLGQKASPWGSTPSAAPSTGGAVFGSSGFGNAAPSAAPAFGKPSAIGFGQSSQLGAKSSPWASAAGGASAAAPAFGQSGFSSFANNNNTSPFGKAAADGQTSASGGFASFASKSGFASVSNDGNKNVFGSGNKPAGSAFGSTSNAETAFPAKPSSGSPFGSTPFKLQSSFKPDGSAKDDNAKPSGSLFGSAFGSALTDPNNKPAVATPAPRDEDMDTAGVTEETPQPKSKDTVFGSQQSPESTTPTTTPAPSKFGFATSPAPQASAFGQPSKFGSTGGLFGNKTEAPKPSGGLFGAPSSTPKPSSGLFSSNSDTPKPSGGLFGSQQSTPKPSIFGTQQKPASYSGIFGQKSEPPKAESPKIKQEEDDAPLPPDPTPKFNPFASPATSAKPEAAPLPPDFTSKTTQSTTKSAEAADAPLPPDFVNVSKPTAADAPLPPDPTISSKPRSVFDKPEGTPKAPSSLFPAVAGPPSDDSDDEEDEEDEEGDEGEDEDAEEEEEEEEEGEEEDDNGSEGSGVDVAKDLSPTITALSPGYTPQSSFGGPGNTLGASRANQEGSRPLFGELSRNAPVFPRPNATSPRSPSPVRGAVPNRVLRSENMRSVSAPGVPGPRQSRMGASITSKDSRPSEDPFVAQHRKLKAKQEAAETQPLVDEEDDEVHKLLASEVEGSLTMDEFIAHSNVAPPAKESIPSQVEAVYRDINSMIDTLGLNSRTVKSFIKGHTENRKEDGRGKDDLDAPEDWVLCEIDELGDVLDSELYADLEDGRVRDLEYKLDACHELTRDMHRLRAKQEDLKQILMIRTDPEQAEVSKSMPLSAEQATQQNELRREFAKFSKLLAEAEEALTLLKTKLVSASSASGKGKANVPTVDAVIRTIGKMTAMVEKRSGDIDVLENQMRKVTLNSMSREGSPMVTPQGRRSIMFSPEGTPVRNLRHSFTASMSLGASVRASTPRKKLSGYSQEEKGGLMQQRARRQAVLGKLKSNVEKQGVSVWTMEDIE
ncbi:hypothetical protein FLONG3_1548 [Fusarium longipes]|uniref:Nucleoporin Nup159/Nup146 N-terminal domain-containing protein n=1 Tax=Fusarium longipes TaxID=694270 RepID=A0A395T7J6_9HYPO|nr:hypothetical protein FLONG3_1548 [Fusarium longipes]